MYGHSVFLLSLCLVFPLAIFGQDVFLDPSGVTLLELGDTVTITCNTTTLTGNLTYEFQLDNEVVQNSTNSSLTITYTDELSVSNGGVYVCSIRMDTDAVMPSQTTLRVFFAPIITNDPDNIFTDSDEIVEFNCTAVGSPAPIVNWYRLRSGSNTSFVDDLDNITGMSVELPQTANVTFDNAMENTRTSTITFDTVQFMDFGDYVCVATLDLEVIESFIADIRAAAENGSGSGSGLGNFVNPPTPNLIIDNSTFDVSMTATLTISPLGSVEATPDYQTVAYNETATFNCTAKGGPNNIFRWIRDTFTFESNIIDLSDFDNLEVFSTEPELTLSLSTGTTGGNYSCVVFNDAGYDYDTVTLYVSPIILTQPTDQFVQNGDRVTLTCEADSFPEPEYQWEKMNMELSMFESVPDETNNTLVFDTIEHSDFGSYRCVVTTLIINETITSDIVTITVSPNNSVMVEPFSNITVDNGEDVVFNCTADGGPNNMFAWVRSEDITDIDTDISAPDSSIPIDINDAISLVSQFIIVNDSMLSFESVNGSFDGGNYTCLVINEAGVGREDTILYVRPVITQQPMDVNAENGTRVVLTCMADSFPEPEYQWEKSNDTDSFNSIYWETQSTLVFDPVDFDDSGIYRCIVTTPIINEQLTSNEAIVTINPLGSVEATPDYQTVAYNETATFNCTANGGPNNTFRWIRDTSSFQSNIINSSDFDNLTVFSTEPELTLSLSTGTTGGNYSCVVFNDAGYDYDTVTLYVSPIILTQPTDQFVQNGDGVTLTCEADSFPEPEYQWEKMNMELSMFESVPDETNNTLVFDTIEHSDFGSYRCVVTTPIINEELTSNEAIVTISPLGSVEATPDYQTVAYNETATFNCTANGGPNNTFHWIRDTSSFQSNIINSSDFDNLTVFSTEPELTLSLSTGTTGGNYSCVVFNDAGYDYDTVTLYVSPIILTQPTDQFVQNGDGVTLTCEADSFPEPEYQWEKMNDDMTMFESVPDETNNTLVFDTIEHSDFGSYRCVVTAPIIDETITSDNVTITVSPNNSVVVEPFSNITVDNGGDVVFNCTAGGGPNNMFAWVRSEDIANIDTDISAPDSSIPIDINDSISLVSQFIIVNDSMLSLESVNGSFDGGNYTCLVINEAGVGREDTILYVRPVITQQPMDVNAENGTRVVLTCMADSFPEPEYQWETLNDTDFFNSIYWETQSTLVFDPVDFDDYGIYRCIVTTPIINEQLTSNEAIVTISPNNSVMVSPSAITIANGSSVTFNCTGRGSEDNFFTWFRSDDLDTLGADINITQPPLDVDSVLSQLSDIIIVNGTNITIDSVNATRDGGSYSCLVLNVAGADLSSGTLFVNPLITISPQDIETDAGKSVSLTCLADSFQLPEYQWQFMNRTTQQFEFIEGENSTELIFLSIDYDQYGMYRCFVTAEVYDNNGGGQIIANVTSDPALVTVSPNGSIVVDPLQVTANRTTSVSFNCDADGGPNNTFYWVKNSIESVDTTDLPSSLTNIVSNNNTLTLDNINGSFGGEYTCVVFNSAGFDTASVTLYVSPEILQDPMNVHTDDNERVVLECTADSFPPPDYQWQLMNATDFENIFWEINSTLVFDPVDFSDFGTYRCVVTTSIINVQVISEEAIITVSPNGSIVVDPPRVTANRTTSVSFNCDADGGPNNTFYWVKNSIESVDTTDLPSSLTNIVSNNNTLTLDNINGSFGGEYTCVVFNIAGFDTASVTLYVSPEILEDPVNVHTDDNERVVLECIADSFPPPNYQWQLMNATDFENIYWEINSTLVFDPVDFSDFGTYRCVVTTSIINVQVISEEAIITVSPFGSISATPTNQTGSRNSTSSFNCSALGGPMNMFNWIKGNNVMGDFTNTNTPINVSMILASLTDSSSDNNELDIIIGSEATSAQMIGGDYSCLVINEAGYDNATVTLYILPEIVQQPIDQFAQNGDSITLTCIGDSFPAPTYQWEKRNMNTDMFEPILGATDSNLVFMSTEHDDYGEYQCVVTTPIIDETITSDIVTITVSPNNSVMVEPFPYITVDNGGDVVFNCTADGGPNNMFAWVRSEDITDIDTDISAPDSSIPIDINDSISLVSQFIIVNDSMLSLESVNGSFDGGNYTCLVINEAGVGREDTILYVRPVITQQPMDVLTLQGEMVTLNCTGDSFPAPEYQWEMMNRSSGMFDVLHQEISTSLVFDTIIYEQYGRYRCRVITPIIDVNITSNEVTITVSPEGSVMIDPQVTNSYNEDMVTLTCSAEGGPNNTFLWTYLRTGLQVANTPEYTVTSNVSTGGDYQCTVSNDAGNDNDTATLNVGPFITENPINLNVSIFVHNITLTCVAMGIPVPFITWVHNDTVLNEDGVIGVYENDIYIDTVEDILGTIMSTLTIDSALANHTGDYYCNATSPVEFYESVMSDIVLVLVQNVPEQPVNLTAIVITSRNVTLTWVEPHDNNAPITQYQVFYVTPSFLGAQNLSALTDDDTEMITITDLHPGETYTFTVIAINEEGNSDRSAPFMIRTLEEVPSGFPQNLIAMTINSTAITVSWDEVLVNETNGVITQYNIIGVSDESFAVTVNETVDNSTFSIVFNNLEEFVVYRFTISASTAIGFGPISPEDSAQTAEAVPASPPVNFTVTAITANNITLEWLPPIEEDINGIIRQYTIRYTIIEQLGVNMADLDMTTLETNVTGNTTLDTVLVDLDNYTVYMIDIVAVTIGEGPTDTIIQRTDENAPETPPIDVTATTNSTTSIIVAWTAPPLNMTNGIIDIYEIRYGRYNSTTSDIFTDISTNITENNSTFEIEIDDLDEFIEYGFQVRAITVAPGPYSEFAVNTTFQAPPSAVPGIPTDAVPNDTLTATSVRLTWDAIPPEDANGELTYNVTITVANQLISRRKRETMTNTLDQCLVAAETRPEFSNSVPGNQTSLTLDNIAPNTNYTYIVAGVTDAGTGPSTAPEPFATREGVPTAPRNVALMNTSSTSLMLEWDQPICDNGNRTGYMITYAPLSGPDPIGETGVQPTVQERSVNAATQMFTGLTPNSPYEVVICAFTNTGCGVNVSMNLTTTEDAPLPVTQLTLNNQSSGSDILVSWLSPSNRNGSFNITFNYTAIQVFIYEDRVQGDTKEMNLLGSETITTQTETLAEVLPYAEYTITLISFNRLFGKTLARESVTTSIISQPIASSVVTNFTAEAITATQILVQWDPPSYPNGPITYFNVCNNNGSFKCYRALPNAASYTLSNLTSMTTNNITVQPITIFEGNTFNGVITDSLSIFIDTVSTDATTGPTVRTTHSVTVTLPNYTVFGENVIFYGVIVSDRGPCEDLTDYGNEYPNPQPYPGNNGYYIAGGWSNTSLIPSEFTVGGRNPTTAILLGQEETFQNPELDNFVRYCVVAFVHQDSGVLNQPINRYVRLANVETRLGYSREALGFFMTVLILLIIAGIVIITVFFLYKRYKTDFYSIVRNKKNSHPLESMNTDTNGGTGLVIMNKPIEDDEARFVDPSSSKKPIPVTEFPAHVSNMHSNDDYLFSVEYPTVEPRHSPTTDATHHPDNAVKNRYANITAYDHSRVRLQEIPNVPGSDYINASFIDGYKAPNCYIASQGPVPGSVTDFWRMVWEQETATIVMLTNLEEKGRVKCSMYWPPPNKRVQVHGFIRVQLQEELYLSDHTIRTFSLQKEKGDERIVKQFHYTAWPDFGVPEHPTPLLRFIRKVENGNPVNAGPMIVHCSAGVGRTGTFVTISTQIKRLKDIQTLDIYNFVQSMRYRRCFMVQTEAQYIFTHDALLEVIECGETEVSARELKDRFRKLSSFNDTEGLMNIEIEYERIQDTIHTEPVRFSGTLQFNRQKNRFHNVIPFDKTRCRLSAIPGLEGSDYVNANFVEGYHKGKAFVATQGPLPDTAEDFWRMIWEYKSSTIVMLAKEKEGSKVMCHRYWPDETTGSEMHGPFEISLHSVREYPDYVLRELKIVDTRDLEGSSQHLKQYHYTGWPTEGVPSSAIGLLDIREQVEKWQRNSGDKPIIVHCSGGCGRTGTYIAMCLLIDRLKTEGVVDIFQTVRGLRLQRPGMVRSVEQYDFTYKGILEYLGSFDNYANFSL